MYWNNSRRMVPACLFFILMMTGQFCWGQTAAEGMFARGMAHKGARAYPAAIAAFDSSANAAATAENWAQWAEARIKGGACLDYDGRTVEAIDHFQETKASIAAKLPDSARWGFEIRIHRSLAYYYKVLGASDLYIRHQQEALQVQEKSGSSPRAIANTYLAIGSQFVQKNDMVQAVTYLEAGLPLATNPIQVSRFWTNLGLAAEHSANPEKAAEAFGTALEIRKNMSPPIPEAVAAAYLYLAGAHLALGDDAAVEFDLAQTEKLLANCVDCEQLWGDFAAQKSDLWKFRGKRAEAVSEGERAVQHFSAASAHGREVALQLVGNGLLRLELEAATAAENDFLAALQILLPDFTPTAAHRLPELDSLRTDPWIFLALQGIADAAYFRFTQDQQLAELETSVQALELALGQASLVRRAFSSEEARLNLSGKIYPLYEKAILRALELARHSGEARYKRLAFAFAEQGKAAVLLEEIAQANSLAHIGLPDSLESRLSSLDINYRYFRQCAQAGTDARATECASRRDAILLERDQLLLKVREQYPAYHAARYQATPIAIGTVQERLRGDEALVEYFFGDSNLVMFLITPGGFEAIQTSLPADLTAHIRGLRGTLSAVGGSEELRAFRRHARALFLQVAEPWISRLPEGTASVTIIPDGLLSYVPFEVLLGEEPGEEIYPKLPYLIRDYWFSYGYSASLRYREAPAAPHADREILACALSFPEAATAAQRAGTDREQLPALPNVLAEAEAIRASFDGEFLLDAAATETAFRERAPQYSLLHLATHTVFNDSNPDATRIVFSHADEVTDGYLHAFELYGLRLDADLAVLSACQTGDGELLRGEGVMSLGRAFTYAGCRSTIMTLWPLNDQSSGEIMATFYAHLADGMARDQALHQAKLTFLDAQNGPRANPFYWAGFIHSGETGPVVKPRIPAAYWIAPIGGVPVLLLLLLLFLRRRARRGEEKIRIQPRPRT